MLGRPVSAYFVDKHSVSVWKEFVERQIDYSEETFVPTKSVPFWATSCYQWLVERIYCMYRNFEATFLNF
jgi:hypothetical protein